MEKWKTLRLFKSIRKTEKQLREDIINGTDKRIILDKLSDEFRIFLSYLTGNNCRTMTAGEFKNLPLLAAESQSGQDTQSGARQPAMDSAFLAGYFRICDTLRFSGADIDYKDLLLLLDDMKRFADYQEEQKKNEQKEKRV